MSTTSVGVKAYVCDYRDARLGMIAAIDGRLLSLSAALDGRHALLHLPFIPVVAPV